MSTDRRLHDFFDGDPNFEPEYHQDYRGESPLSYFGRASFTLPLVIFLAALAYHIFFILDYNLLPLPELLWNCLVYMTPSPVLNAIDSYTNTSNSTKPHLRHIPRTHAAKSEAMRRVLGLDRPGGIIGSVAQAGKRRLSTLPGINMVAQGTGERPPGLGNWDNSCYQNSVLQGLASLDSLSEYLASPKIEDRILPIAPRPDMKMAEALRGLVTILNDPANSGKRIWTPATLKSMSSWQQQDAQEYFSKVLDEVDKEIGNVAGIMRGSAGLESSDSASASLASSNSLPASKFRNPLEGLIAQRVGCTRCGYSEGLSMIPFNCLTVPLGTSWEYDISDCLDEYTKLEQIEGVECGKCTLLKMHRLLATMKERIKDTPDDSPTHKNIVERLATVTEALEEDDYEDKTILHKCKIPPKSRVSSTKSRQAVIARTPKSLAVHFNRSVFDELTGEMRKNTAKVRFPKVLDLGPWCLGSSGAVDGEAAEEWLLNPDQPMIASTANPSRLRGPRYELRAVITHYGRHENGHYVCYKKYPIRDTHEKESQVAEDQWWRLSDDDVTMVTEDVVLSQGGVFLLFYDCIEQARIVSRENSSLEASLPLLSPELDTAVNVPLPDDTDSDRENFIQKSAVTRRLDIPSSASEDEEEDNDERVLREYPPRQAIIVPTYIQKPGIHSESEDTGRQGLMSPGNLLMV